MIAQCGHECNFEADPEPESWKAATSKMVSKKKKEGKKETLNGVRSPAGEECNASAIHPVIRSCLVKLSDYLFENDRLSRTTLYLALVGIALASNNRKIKVLRHSVRQSVSPLVSQSVSQSVARSVSQSANQSTGHQDGQVVSGH